MHLNAEKKTIYMTLAFTWFFFMGLMGLTIWASEDKPNFTVAPNDIPAVAAAPAETDHFLAFMSLKAFHLIFVICTTLFCLFMGLWTGRQWLAGEMGSQWQLLYAILSFAGTLLTPVYGYYFLKKLKGVSYL